MVVRGKIKSILFILDGYPIAGSKACVFARNLIVSLADMGIKCIVIAPQIISRESLKKKTAYKQIDITPGGKEIIVYEPLYLHMSSRPAFLGISMKNHFAAAKRVIEKENLCFDAVYGHFIYHCGLTASKIGEMYNVPSFLAAGESDKLLPDCKRCRGAYQTGLKRYNWNQRLSKLAGVISVSEWTKVLLINGGFIHPDAKVGVFPNGVNQNIFHVGDKEKIRDEMNIPQDGFLITYVGAFNENKGSERLSAAIDRLEDNVYSVFIGRDGDCEPTCKNILFCGQCDNVTVAKYLQASDCFVLPTRSEGCCNAILEALSSGVPVISSDLPFNDGIVDDNNGIRINADSIKELSEAIQRLMKDSLLMERLRNGAACSSQKFDINDRAKRIYEFMEFCSK